MISICPLFCGLISKIYSVLYIFYSIAQLTLAWIETLKAGKIAGLTLRFYKAGYKGLLTGDSFVLDEKEWEGIDSLNYLGGSPIGNSRVKASH